MELNVLNIEGKETGRKVKLNTAVFGIEPNTSRHLFGCKIAFGEQTPRNTQIKGAC